MLLCFIVCIVQFMLSNKVRVEVGVKAGVRFKVWVQIRFTIINIEWYFTKL